WGLLIVGVGPLVIRGRGRPGPGGPERSPTLALRVWRSLRSIAVAKTKPRKSETRETPNATRARASRTRASRGSCPPRPSSGRWAPDTEAPDAEPPNGVQAN